MDKTKDSSKDSPYSQEICLKARARMCSGKCEASRSRYREAAESPSVMEQQAMEHDINEGLHQGTIWPYLSPMATRVFVHVSTIRGSIVLW